MIPYPDPVVIRILATLPATADSIGDRVSTSLGTALPALRVTKVGDAEAPRPEEAAPLYQIEVWAEDEFTAGQIAWDIRNAWTTSKRQIVRDALVHGRWVEIDPRYFPDTDNAIADRGTDFPRYILTVGLRLSGASA